MRTTTYLEWGIFLDFVIKSKRDFPLVSICAVVQGFMGLRVSDVMQLKWSDFEKKMIVLKEKKTGKTRNITVQPELKKYLDILIKEKELYYCRSIYIDELLLTGRNGDVVSIQYLNRIVKDAFDSLGLKTEGGNNSTHIFRKTFGRRVIDKCDKPEAGLILLSEVFKHSSTAITRRYLGLREAEVQSVYSLVV